MFYLLISFEFLGLLAVTKLLPVYLLFAGGLVLLTGVLIIGLLTGDVRKKALFAIGSLLAVLMVVVLVIGNLYILKT